MSWLIGRIFGIDLTQSEKVETNTSLTEDELTDESSTDENSLDESDESSTTDDESLVTVDHSRDFFVPLKNFHINAQIEHTVAEIKFIHTWINKCESPIEALYMCPIPYGSTVISGFEAETSSGKIVGKLMSRNAADDVYAEAISNGKSAFMCEEHDEDVVQIAIGNILPNETVTTTLTMIMQLNSFDYKTLELRLPTRLGSRYTSNWLLRNPSLGSTLKAEYKASLHLEAESCYHITGVAYNNSTKFTQKPDFKCLLDLADIEMNQDLVIRLSLQDPYGRPTLAPVCLTSTNEDNETIGCLSWLQPQFADINEQLLPELSITNSIKVFIIDRSGSMYTGCAIKCAIETTINALNKLADGTPVVIISFGSECRLTSNAVEILTPTVRQDLIAKVSQMKANMGGTELNKAIKSVLDVYEITHKPMDIYLITDGEIELMQRSAIANDLIAHTNITLYCFAIGHNTSIPTVRRLAECTGGITQFVSKHTLNENVDKILKQSDVTAVEISSNFPGLPADTMKVYPNNLYQYYAHIDKASSIWFNNGVDSEYVHKYPIKGTILYKAFIGKYIREWQFLQPEGYKVTIENLSLKCGIMSEFTNFVGVSQRHTTDIGPALVMPVAQPKPLVYCGAAPELAHYGTNHQLLRKILQETSAIEKCNDNIKSAFGLTAIPVPTINDPNLNYLNAFDYVFRGPKTRHNDCWLGSSLFYGLANNYIARTTNLGVATSKCMNLLRNANMNLKSTLRKKICQAMQSLKDEFIKLGFDLKSPQNPKQALSLMFHIPDFDKRKNKTLLAIEQVDSQSTHGIVLAQDDYGYWWLYDGTHGDKDANFQGGRLKQALAERVVTHYRKLMI